MANLIEVVVGRVGRAHGIRGEMAVELRTDEPERRFADGAVLRLEGRAGALTVATHRWHGERLLVRFDGVDDRTGVEALRGGLLLADVPDDQRPEEEDEFYDRQLVGLRVLDHQSSHVGQITGVVHLPTQDLLTIDVAGVERLVPFVTELVPVIDIEGGFVRLADVGGLLDEMDG